MSESPFLHDLNPQQREAVLHADGPLLVLSGAGSGKTRVITRRMALLIREREVFPWRILAVTFTNKAAREMRERLGMLMGPEAEGVTVSTFHSACAMILRREAEAVGLSRSFVIYDDTDQLQVMRRAMREVGVDASSVNARELLGRVDQAKNAALTPDEVMVHADDERGQVALRAYRAYERLLRAANAVDYGDLLLLVVKLFQRSAETLGRYRARYRHILVDEFQDTNPVQYELLRLLAPPKDKPNLVVVGDDDQSIYRWRGAEVDHILNFEREYPGTTVVRLEQNYRSDQNILDAANAVISENRRRLPKRMWSDRPKGEHLALVIARDERGEAQEIARRMHAMAREGFIGFGGMAVFFRVNAQSRVLEEALRLARVPYALVSGRSFYERAEVKDAASYLRLMVNPRSDTDLLRIINTPARGIGETTVERLMDYATSMGASLYEALSYAAEISTLNAGAIKRLVAFRALVDGLVSAARAAPDAHAAVQQMLEASGMVRAYEEEGTTEAMGRAENLSELLTAAQEFDLMRAQARTPVADPEAGPEVALTPLEAFLEQISLVTEADADAGQGRVSLMTVHAAKGLEFDAVFVTGLEDNVFPHSRALKPEASPDELEEERRLCYVALTRARRRLVLSLAQMRAMFGELKQNPPSRFLRSVPPAVFGFDPEEALEPPRRAPVMVRRRTYDEDDDRPRIDRSYDQTGEHYSSSPVGARVRHEQFGEGRIIACDGQGPNAKLTVDFGARVGLKRVVARFLQPV